MVLRKAQIDLINGIMGRLRKGIPIVHQMIMGGGKTTVIGPLLALLLADRKSLVVQVVPLALLEMSRSVMREKFSAVIHKPGQCSTPPFLPGPARAHGHAALL